MTFVISVPFLSPFPFPIPMSGFQCQALQMTQNNVEELFKTMNAVLSHLSNWFCVNKLSLNTDKTKCALFHKFKSKDNLLLVTPYLFFSNAKIKRENSPKLLGVMIDQNLTWKTHVALVEKKVSESVGILFKVSGFINSKSFAKYIFCISFFICKLY